MATVLVVDDDPLATEVLLAVLKRAGHLVHSHDSGFGLAVAIHRCRPDVVLLDVNMPGLSGPRSLAAAGELDASYALETRVLLHSGMPADDLHTLALHVGAHGSLSKPARPSQVADAIAACLELPARRLGTG